MAATAGGGHRDPLSQPPPILSQHLPQQPMRALWLPRLALFISLCGFEFLSFGFSSKAPCALSLGQVCQQLI